MKAEEILRRLEPKCITLEKMLDTAMELYIGEDTEKIREKLKSLMLYYLSDINVQSLLMAAILLEENFKVEGDPVNLIADELIGINIAEYIGGKIALFNFFYYDTKKPGILKELPPFLDDAIGGFIAGCMTKLFEPTNFDLTEIPSEERETGKS
ncbi:alpha-ribazole phosphatase CobZ [Thermococcus sp. M39]|uniref:alpha-ribazole phosphatase CobZ n=1 Tax=unclassified Thermococcus TaxID=2627626 RepID=UPI00143AC75D|nr:MULTISPECIES: alpha-ribazole phosphatase CobZ [unclassified Thermococcus]NJE09116.1 alpha-ribazole phosphatase CobZ [Thermococcus sp. M39]NJE12065.1 alpha-ribazole phosphatase CobZ [Thermococcus sp. LS2]